MASAKFNKPVYKIEVDTPREAETFAIVPSSQWPRSRSEVFDEIVANAVPDAIGHSARVLRPEEYKNIAHIVQSGFRDVLYDQVYLGDEETTQTPLLERLKNDQLEIPGARNG